MRALIVFALLVLLKGVSHLCFRPRRTWVGTRPGHPWRAMSRLRLVAVLNHTSLFEPLFITMVPLSFVWRVARHGVVPIAEKTLSRPLVGRFFSLIGAHVVSLSRERDHTWRAALAKIGPDSMVMILPEGRMMRANGLDSKGEPMTVRGGIADILESIDDGDLLLAYSGGLHHVQIPGQRLPRLFQTLRMALEIVSIRDYREAREREAAALDDSFRRRVKEDLEERRNRHCPLAPGTTAPEAGETPAGWPPPATRASDPFVRAR